MQKNKFSYKWNLSDGYPAKGIKENGLKVFGTFVCGGGSTMGYKLAGYDCLGGVEIDPKIAQVYKVNHKPKYLYVEDIRKFADNTSFEKDLYNLDILDGSPPCSSFSMAGNRDKDWGKEKIFREGQSMQRLDDLFFDYIRLAEKLQPKVVIAENVKGMLQGNAKAYVKRINREFDKAGYKVQLFLLNAATMGVPQRRERIFFICQRNDLQYKPLNLTFDEKRIQYKEIESGNGKPIKGQLFNLWEKCKIGKSLSTVHPKKHYFGSYKIKPDEICPTIIASTSSPILHYNKPKYLSKEDLCQIGTFPLDYNFLKIEPKYLIGMSVPPVMIGQIAYQIYLQWFSKGI